MAQGRRELGVWSVLVALTALACGGTGTTDDNGDGVGGSPGSGGAAGGSGGAVATGGSAHQTGGYGGLPPGVEAPETAAELCEAYPEAWGAFMARCHDGAPEDWQFRVESPCGPTAAAEDEGRVTLNADRVEDCFAVLARDDCAALDSDVCEGLTSGTVPEGQPCENLGYGDECQPGTTCDLIDECGGICQALGVEGGTCHGQFVDTVCGPGLECDGPSAGCVIPGAEGETCSGRQGACLPGLYCGGDDEAGFSCRPDETAGPCDAGQVCAVGFTCAMGEAGLPASCQKEKLSGEACTFGRGECAGFCTKEGICDVTAEEGESCSFIKLEPDGPTESGTCGAGLFCYLESDDPPEYVCRSQAALGDPCLPSASGNACQELNSVTYCASDVCMSCD